MKHLKSDQMRYKHTVMQPTSFSDLGLDSVPLNTKYSKRNASVLELILNG